MTDFQTNVTYTRLITCSRLQWLVTCKDFRLPEDGSDWVAETCRSNLNNNKLINEKLICAFRWSVLPSIMKMHGPKTKEKIKKNIVVFVTINVCTVQFVLVSQFLIVKMFVL